MLCTVFELKIPPKLVQLGPTFFKFEYEYVVRNVASVRGTLLVESSQLTAYTDDLEALKTDARVPTCAASFTALSLCYGLKKGGLKL